MGTGFENVLKVTHLPEGKAIGMTSQEVFDMARTDCSAWDRPDVMEWIEKMERIHKIRINPNDKGWTFYRPVSR